jgi:hypothetical protein
VDATCDATTVIMQEIVHSDGTLTDRVYLLWDGHPSQATVWIINTGEHRTLTCNQSADECYVETNDGLTFTTPNPILLHPGDSTSSAAALFVECVRLYASTTGIKQAVRAIVAADDWLRSGQKRP